MRSALLALALAAAGCGPTLIWSGRTPDRLHDVRVVRDSGLDYVVVDGQRRAAYHGVAGWSVALAPDHIAFAARVGARWTIVHDGRIGRETWDGIGELRLAADGSLVYIAQRGRSWYVVARDGHGGHDLLGPAVDAVLAGTLRIAGNHIAYVGQRGPKVHAVVDGQLGPAYDGIGQLSLAADGRIAYAARINLEAHAVIDGAVGPACDGIAQLQLGPYGHSAYVATFGDETRLVIDGEPGAAVESIRDIVFRDDGAHVAWLGRMGKLDVLALDDHPVATWPARRAAKIAFRPTSVPASPAGQGAVAAGVAGVGLAYVQTTEQPLAGEQLVIDGAVGPIYDEVHAPVWAPDGHVAYAARRGRQWLIVDGIRELDAGDAVGDPVFAGTRMGYAGRRGKTSYVAVDGREYPYDLVFVDTVLFSADGARWGAVAGDRTREQLFLVIDGARRIPVAVHELYSAVASGSGEWTLRDWLQAELDRPR
jgi:hypothetical protein